MFESSGSLSPGIHVMEPSHFIDTFCKISEERKIFFNPIRELIEFSKETGATYIIIGGSFVTQKKAPNDLDVLIVYPDYKSIPYKTENLVGTEVRIDIQFCSEDDRFTLDHYIYLFSRARGNAEVGLIQINLGFERLAHQIIDRPDTSFLEIIKKAYLSRHFVDINQKKGILVTIHGIMSNAAWNFSIAPAASAQGWIVAPFYYGKISPWVLVSDAARKQILEKFRHWLYYIFDTYREPISIVAHSFGTYLVGAYLDGFKSTNLPVSQFNSIVLTGSILSSDFDWNLHRKKIGYVKNVRGVSDTWVNRMPRYYPGRDILFGNAGVSGFSQQCNFLHEDIVNLVDHYNAFGDDLIKGSWLPFINSNVHAGLDISQRK